MTGGCTCSALRMAARRLTQIYDAALAGEGLNTSQYALLNRLHEWPGGDPIVSELAERLGLDRTTLAHNLRPLERDGLVSISPDVDDRRARRVRLTTLGRAKREACLPLWRSAQDNFNQTFGASRAASLMRELAAVAACQNTPPRRQENPDAR